MTRRAEEILNAAIGDGTTKSMNVLIADVLYLCADRMYTDWGELQHPAGVLREMADEVLTLELDNTQ